MKCLKNLIELNCMYVKCDVIPTGMLSCTSMDIIVVVITCCISIKRLYFMFLTGTAMKTGVIQGLTSINKS